MSALDINDLMLTEDEVREPVATSREYETPEVRAERRQDQQGRRIHVLITVKTTPQPSTKYVDTVCVAGIALGQHPRWVRLYPVPFRYLPSSSKFKKYAIIAVDVSRSTRDQRFESLHVNAESITTEAILPTDHGWLKRSEFVEPMGETTVCDLRAGIRADGNGPSLGLVRPALGSFSLKIVPHPGWTEMQNERLREQARQQELDLNGDDNRANVGLLAPPQLKIWTRFRCLAKECPGHELGFLDWEATALQRNYAGQHLADIENAIRENFEKRVLDASKLLRIYVGNQADPTKRAAFEALGLYYPTSESARLAASALALF